MNYSSLLELNKKSLETKLDKAQKIGNLWVCNDIIDILSNQAPRDKRMINDYETDEISTYTVKRADSLRKVRLFTQKGINRYLHEGKLYDYPNACAYFSVEPRDLASEALLSELSSFQNPNTKKYQTNRLLKWLFGKRKMCKSLGPETDLQEVYNLFNKDTNVDQAKLEVVKGLVNY